MRVCPLFLHEKSSYCLTQEAELLIFTELINSASFFSNNVLILNPTNEITHNMF